MLLHRALGRDLDQLQVSVIDNRRPMLAMMRAMLAAIGAGHIETHENPVHARAAMERSTPDLIIAATSMQPVAGPDFVRSIRREDAGPLRLVPAMIMSAHAQAGLVAEALRAGAHQVLVLPISASTLYRRLDWLVNDDRPFELKDGHYVVEGLEERLALSVPRPVYALAPARAPLAVGEN
jgi:two-component system, OmpR family, phosphate regulon response regulator PhoB